jgi:hypothetical protein
MTRQHLEHHIYTASSMNTYLSSSHSARFLERFGERLYHAIHFPNTYNLHKIHLVSPYAATRHVQDEYACLCSRPPNRTTKNNKILLRRYLSLPRAFCTIYTCANRTSSPKSSPILYVQCSSPSLLDHKKAQPVPVHNCRIIPVP